MTPAPHAPPGIFFPQPCRDLIAQGALCAVNTSGGKDSQTMTILLSRKIPPGQLVAVHAPLEDVEWPGTVDFIRATLPPGMPLLMAPVASGETLLQRIERRGLFPHPRRRYCTSDFKRTPIERQLRRYLKAHPRYQGLIVNAMGFRRDESAERAKRNPWSHNPRNSKAGRSWYDWLPIFDFSESDVFNTIAAAGQGAAPRLRERTDPLLVLVLHLRIRVRPRQSRAASPPISTGASSPWNAASITPFRRPAAPSLKSPASNRNRTRRPPRAFHPGLNAGRRLLPSPSTSPRRHIPTSPA